MRMRISFSTPFKMAAVTAMKESTQETQKILRNRLLVTEHLSGEGDYGVLQSTENACRTVKSLLERTILHGEGNSLLIIGPRGSGKSWVVEQVLRSLDSDAACRKNYIKVSLNGLVHTDDRLALQEIARQLDEDLGEKSSLPFATALNYLLEALKSGDHANQSIVFILDEFDLFAHHKNQTLLYNLFDITQSAQKTPIAVVGLTNRLDVVELLEKRVKSRFSHRQISLLSDFEFEDYLRVFRTYLTLPEDFSDREYRQKWEKHLEELTVNASVRDALRQQYNVSPDIGNLKTMLVLPVCRLGFRKPFLDPVDFTRSRKMVARDSTLTMLQGLSVLELCLVIAMKHLTEISDGETFNFEMVYNDYKKFTQRSHSMEFFSKPVALKAFEHLISLEFVCPADSGSSRSQKEYQSMMLNVDEDQVATAVQQYPNCPTEVARWGTSRGMA